MRAHLIAAAVVAVWLTTAAVPVLIESGRVGPTSLTSFGMPPLSADAIDLARQHGLRYVDRPSFGSGLTWIGGDEFVSTTDRGPNDDRPEVVGRPGAILFPLPAFTPTLIHFVWRDGRIAPLEYFPLHDVRGRGVTGLPNSDADGSAFDRPQADRPLPPQPNGLDVEAIQRFPDGRYLLGDEYGPSLVVASASGEVLMRYTPVGWNVQGATYPTRAILPAVLRERRRNRGFENVALSADGRTAYAVLESPLGATTDSRFAAGRLLRALKLDVSDPLQARVVAEYIVEASAVAAYPGTASQNDIKTSDAAWLAPDQILMLERGLGLVRLFSVDFGAATNVLERSDAAGTDIESSPRTLAEQQILPARRELVFDSRDVPAIDESKLEGLAVVSPTDVVLMTDNDFGIGDNVSGAPCKIWRIRLPQALPGPSRRSP